MATLGNRAKNARKQAERRKAFIAQKMQHADADRQQAYIRQLDHYNDVIERTRAYSGGKKIQNRTAAERAAAVAELEALNRETFTATQERRAAKGSNTQFKAEIKAVSGGQIIEGKTETQVRVFFRATQRAWEGKPVSQRYEAIMDYYKEYDLNVIWDRVMQLNEQQIDLINDINDENLTPEQRAYKESLKAFEDDQEKAYRSFMNSPTIGSVASNVISLE